MAQFNKFSAEGAGKLWVISPLTIIRPTLAHPTIPLNFIVSIDREPFETHIYKALGTSTIPLVL